LFIGYLCFIGAFFSDDVRVESNLPGEMISGRRHLIEVEIAKGSLQGFSKLELSVPTGFSVLPSDIQGASFTFSGGRARFVWMEMPPNETFTVSYFIESEPNREGIFEISGVFSYVNENIRKDLKIPSRQIKLVPMQNVVMQEHNLKDDVELVCERYVTRMNESEFQVRLVVRNNQIKGFGKVLETLPSGCVARKLNDGGSVVTQDANTIKFVWFEVPDAATFEVSYLVSCPVPCEEINIQGQISYTENRKPFTIDVVNVESATALAKSSQEITNDKMPGSAEEVTSQGNTVTDAASKVDAAEAVTKNTESETQVTDKVQQANSSIPVAEQSQGSSKNDSAGNTSANADARLATNDREKSASNIVSEPARGVTYSVQILAAHRIVEKTYFNTRHGYSGGYNIENHDGWVKYVAGKYDAYTDARAAREGLKQESRDLPGPFVTAYQDGERISVQEALLVSNQRWIP
ncbi:MAG: hypothetical protein ACKOW8_15725, partial [Flavobacteriales bacterium]